MKTTSRQNIIIAVLVGVLLQRRPALILSSKAGRGNCMVRHQIASSVVVVGGLVCAMYPACLWRQVANALGKPESEWLMNGRDVE